VAKLAEATAAAERASSLDALIAEWDSLTMDGRRAILRDLVAAGWVFSLRPFVEGEPDVRIMVIPPGEDAADADWPDGADLDPDAAQWTPDAA
jgi:hypothetical protein